MAQASQSNIQIGDLFRLKKEASELKRQVASAYSKVNDSLIAGVAIKSNEFSHAINLITEKKDAIEAARDSCASELERITDQSSDAYQTVQALLEDANRTYQNAEDTATDVTEMVSSISGAISDAQDSAQMANQYVGNVSNSYDSIVEMHAALQSAR